nr:Zn-ribbon domain-containing OB-fold protein [Microbacterium immunditiarum]
MPLVDVDTSSWWSAVAEGRLLIETCTTCGHAYLYPRRMCPSCWSPEVQLVEVSGRGTVYTSAIVRMNDLSPFKDWVPYALAMVELEEGQRLMTNVVGIAPEEVRIGMPVRFEPRDLADGIAAPVFVPIPEGDVRHG